MNDTHDFSDPKWGKHCSITTVIEGGKWLKVYGHSTPTPKQDDFVILKNDNNTTRYLVENITFPSAPHDMWFATLVFAPRDDRK